GEPALIHIAVDTGMSRIGITPDEKGLAFAVKAMNTPGIEIEGIFTHFARADEESGKNATQLQFEKFTGLIRRIEEMTGRKIPLRHCANSAAIIDYPEMHLDMVRAGITTYGLWPSDEVTKERLDLKPVMSLFSHITFIKDVPAGTPVSYGGTYVTEKTMRIATVPVGYGDGYPRSLSNKGYVLIRGKKAPIIGRVCMDQLMVCVDEIPEAMEGDLVTLLGRDGAEEITAEMLGDLSGRFNYELTCNINQRVPRDYTLT
ncbi:MAG: alanine racemase, partial [Lachnospiraceae bacterium]|nr:alanine racemase [Lachnospiraceae bacterium]